MEPVAGVHDSTPIPLEDFEFGCMKPLSYTREALSAAIVHNVRRSLDPEQSRTSNGRTISGSGTKNLSPRQRQAIERFKYQGNWNLSQPSNIEDIKKFFEIFHDAYFGGLLKGHCRFEFPSSVDCRDKRYGLGPPLGVSEAFLPKGEFAPRDTRFQIEKPYVTISIQMDNSRDMYDQIKNYLGTLLHEMLHVMFFIYTCRCEHGCKQRISYAAGGGPYLESHHIGWQAAAFAIEKADAVGRCLPGLSIDLRGNDYMVFDIQSWHNLPNDAALRSADLDIAAIRRTLRWLRARKVKETREIANVKSFKGNSCILNYRGRYKGESIESCWPTVRVRYPSEFHPDMPF